MDEEGLRVVVGFVGVEDDLLVVGGLCGVCLVGFGFVGGGIVGECGDG